MDPVGPSPDLAGWAAVISAAGVTVASIITAVVLAVTRRTDRLVTQIDHAVNGKAPGKVPMVDQVEDLHAEIPSGKRADTDQAALLPLVRYLVDRVDAMAEKEDDDG